MFWQFTHVYWKSGGRWEKVVKSFIDLQVLNTFTNIGTSSPECNIWFLRYSIDSVWECARYVEWSITQLGLRRGHATHYRLQVALDVKLWRNGLARVLVQKSARVVELARVIGEHWRRVLRAPVHRRSCQPTVLTHISVIFTLGLWC